MFFYHTGDVNAGGVAACAEVSCIMKIYDSVQNSIGNLNRFEKCLWAGSAAVVAASFVLAKSGDWMTLIASLIGVTALIFVAKGDVLGQILTILFSVVYSIISFYFAYYGEMATYMGMTAPIALLSVITWLRNPYSQQQVKVNRLRARGFAVLFMLAALVTWGFYYILSYFHTANIVFSTISVTTSFLASALMMLRSPYYAVAYAANDLVLIVLWVLASMESISYVPMVACFVIFFVNDLYGFHNWVRMQTEQNRSECG